MENMALLEKISRESLALFSALKAISVTLANIQGEADPALTAADMSYAVEYAAGICEVHYSALMELKDK